MEYLAALSPEDIKCIVVLSVCLIAALAVLVAAIAGGVYLIRRMGG